MGRTGKVFIDANIINLAVIYKREDVLAWINSLYEEIYIHISVMNELITNKGYAVEQIENGTWIVFDPDDENCSGERARIDAKVNNTYIVYEKNGKLVKEFPNGDIVPLNNDGKS